MFKLMINDGVIGTDRVAATGEFGMPTTVAARQRNGQVATAGVPSYRRTGDQLQG